MIIEISIENKDKIIKKCLQDVRKKYSDLRFIDVFGMFLLMNITMDA